MRQVISYARCDRHQTIYQTITAKTKSERVAEGGAIIASLFAGRVAVAA